MASMSSMMIFHSNKNHILEEEFEQKVVVRHGSSQMSRVGALLRRFCISWWAFSGVTSSTRQIVFSSNWELFKTLLMYSRRPIVAVETDSVRRDQVDPHKSE